MSSPNLFFLNISIKFSRDMLEISCVFNEDGLNKGVGETPSYSLGKDCMGKH